MDINIIENEIKNIFEKLEDVAHYNTAKVLKAFSKYRVSDSHLKGSLGYGYDDKGRETLDRIYAEVFGCEKALVRHGFVSGTHTLSVMLFGVLRPGNTLLSITSKPYDTLMDVIGISGKENQGSLKDFQIDYKQVELIDGCEIDIEAVEKALSDEKIKAVFIQRSRGYMNRKALSVEQIEKAALRVKSIRPDVYVLVDNCYGEFCEKNEPVNGVDLIAGSLIKNPGGGMAETGGYIAGKAEAVDLCAYRYTTPGIGDESGATLNQLKLMYKGLFYAPHTVTQALKTAVFASRYLQLKGFEVSPLYDEERFDIIQSVQLKTKENLLKFLKGIQSASPIDSYVTPEPWAMPGYDCEVCMAAGAFVQGSSIELSADAPMKEPYTAYLQGGLTYESGRYAIIKACENL